MARRLSNAEIEACAKTAHEMNRNFNSLMGDNSYKAWDASEEWVKTSARASVLALAEFDFTPSQLHDMWVAEKRSQGWTYGVEKDFQKRTHPCLVVYSDLLEEHRIKDMMWSQCVKLMLDAIWRIPQ